MSRDALRETLGFLAVVASMIFVGLEIRQNTIANRAATRQAMVEGSFEFILSRANNPALNRQIIDWRTAAPGDPVDCDTTHAEACVFVFGLLRHHENLFVQVREGVVDESVFQSYGWSGNTAYTSPFFPELWVGLRDGFDEDFRSAFESEYGLEPG